MNTNFKPEGYTSVSPYFVINGAHTFIDLMMQIFDAKLLRRYDGDGRVMHAELQIDDSVIMLSDATEKWPQIAIFMHVYVSDVDAVYAKAIGAGCENIEAPKEQAGDPDRRATFRDFAGNVWSVGTQKNT